MLPGMNGRDGAWRNVRCCCWPAAKVLFMPGYSHKSIVHQGRLAPGVEMIQQPMSQRDLAGRIRDMLDAAPRTKTPPRRRGPRQ